MGVYSKKILVGGSIIVQLLTYAPVLGLHNFFGTLVRVDLLKQELLSSNGSDERAGLGSVTEVTWRALTTLFSALLIRNVLYMLYWLRYICRILLGRINLFDAFLWRVINCVAHCISYILWSNEILAADPGKTSFTFYCRGTKAVLSEKTTVSYS